MKCLILLYERSRPALLQVNHVCSKYDLYSVLDLYSQQPKDQIENLSPYNAIKGAGPRLLLPICYKKYGAKLWKNW